MKAILINRELSRQEQMSVEDKARKGGTVFRKDEYNITEEEKKQINYETMDQVVAFGNKEFEGISVAGWLGFDDSSLWYYHKFRAYFRLRNLKYEMAAIKKLASESERVLCFVSDPLLARAELPAHVKIILPGNSEKSKKSRASMISYAIIMGSRWLLNGLSINKLKRPDHVIMDVSKRQVFLNRDTLREAKGNYVIGYLLEKADDDFLIIDEAVQPKMSEGAKISLNGDHLFGKGKWHNRYFGEPILLNYFLSRRCRKRKKEIIKKLNRGMRNLGRQTSGDEKLLISILRSFRGATNFYLIKYLAYKRFFEKHSFKTITTTDENSPAQRAVLEAARTEGVITIGVQHGTIHDLHPAYIYSEKDIERKAVPDHTLAWSEFWKEFLVKNGNYKPEGLHIIGQLRTDVIPGLIRANIPLRQILPGIPEEEKLIVFASQPQRDPELRKKAALDVMHAVRSTEDAFLFIKLHPNEKYDTEYYRSLADEAGLKKLKISLNIDLYLLISACDVLITCFSTVGAETVYFNKPLVILDHLQQDIQNYFKEGVAFRATNRDELAEQLKGILSGQLSIDAVAYSKFIEKYAFAIDGKASERALGEIERLSD